MTILGEQLIQRGLVTSEQLTAAEARQTQLGGRLGTALLELDALSEDALLEALSEQLSLPAADPERLRAIDPDVWGLLPARLAVRSRAIPFRAAGNVVDMAMLDVRNLSLQDELSFVIGKRLRIHIANEVRIMEALQTYYGKECPIRFTSLLGRLNRRREQWKSDPEPAAPQPVPQPLAAVAAEPLPAARKRIVLPPKNRKTSIPLSKAERAALETSQGPAPPPGAHDPLLVPPVSDSVAPPPVVAEPRPRDEIKRFALLLRETRNAGEVGAALLAELGQDFVRCILFRVRRGLVSGWMGRGPGLRRQRLTDYFATLDEASVFSSLVSGEPFRGSLSPLPAHLRLFELWRGRPGTECTLMPLLIRGRLVAVVYGDRDSIGLEDLDPSRSQRLIAEAAAALERCILRRKNDSIDTP